MGRARRQRRRVRLALFLLVVAILAAAAYVYAERAQPPAAASVPADTGTLRVHYVDVGQGDGTIWELPDGTIVVYDCGPPAPDAKSNPIVAYLRDVLGRPPGSPLRALVASHGHLDHVGGCEEVLAEYAVLEVYEAWYEGDDAPESYRRFLREVEAEGARVHRLPAIRSGTTLAPGATLLWPDGFASGGWDSIAEASLVVRLQHGRTSFCFQGDIETAQEAALVERLPAQGCDVYLVGHHGSRHASSGPWLARMSPSIAVVSFGENSYGHPHPEALCRVQASGATVYATHRSGGVVVSSDGASVRLERGVAEQADACAGASYWR